MKGLKNTILLLFTIIIVSCNTKELHPEYVEISGKIVNAKSKVVSIYGMGGANKTIPIKENGAFKDSLKIKKGVNKYQLMLLEDKIISSLYAENGSNIHLEADANNFRKTLQFDLDFADINNYTNKKSIILSSEKGFNNIWYRENEIDFNKKIEVLKAELNNTLKTYSNISSDKVKNEIAVNEQFIKRFASNYAEENGLANKLTKGVDSPIFENYENYDGSTVSLSDFKGKYVYIDVWATWCTPCKAQIPFLEKTEKKFHGKNIAFVSISVDKAKDYDKWKDMVKAKNMSGIQLIAPGNFKSDFVKKYGITSIPRFILIDPKGKIVDFDAIRPSNPELNNQLNELL